MAWRRELATERLRARLMRFEEPEEPASLDRGLCLECETDLRGLSWEPNVALRGEDNGVLLAVGEDAPDVDPEPDPEPEIDEDVALTRVAVVGDSEDSAAVNAPGKIAANPTAAAAAVPPATAAAPMFNVKLKLELRLELRLESGDWPLPVLGRRPSLSPSPQSRPKGI